MLDEIFLGFEISRVWQSGQMDSLDVLQTRKEGADLCVDISQVSNEAGS